MKIRIVIAACLALWAGLAEAQGRRLIDTVTPARRDAAQLLKDLGCDEAWVSKALADSGFKPAQARNLPVGGKLYLSAKACQAKPDKATRAKSEAILHPEPQAAPDTPVPVPTASSEELDKVKALVSSLASRVENLETRRNNGQKVAEPKPGFVASGNSRVQRTWESFREQLSKLGRAEISFLLVGILLLVLFYYFAVWRFRKQVPPDRRVTP